MLDVMEQIAEVFVRLMVQLLFANVAIHLESQIAPILELAKILLVA
jgi:hypothetical protein